MGVRERFIYSKNASVGVQQLGEMIATQKVFDEDIWINCKCIAVNELAMDFAMLSGEKVTIQPFHLVPGQEVLCVGHDSSNELLTCFSEEVLKDLVVIDNWVLYELNYKDVFRDEPIEIFGKTYFAELIEDVTQKQTGIDGLVEDAKIEAEQLDGLVWSNNDMDITR